MAKVIAIIAGGTGGHVIPALSIAQALKEKGYRIVWLGSEHGIDQKLVPQAGYPLFPIPAYRLSSRRITNLIKAPATIRRGVKVARDVYRRYKPCLVISMGSYISIPGAIAARLSGIPVVIHEQNAIAGRANRFIARFSQRVLSAFPSAFNASKKVFYTGNPVRDRILQAAAYEAESIKDRPFKILIVGGSQGAKFFNDVIPEALAKFPLSRRPKVWHQVRVGDDKEVLTLYHHHNIDATVHNFIEDMAEAYEWADLVIARAGAMTIAELTAIGMPSVLIPYPHAKDNHQYYNAASLSEKGAAITIEQDKCDAGTLYHQLQFLSETPDALKKMSKAAKELAKREATEEVVNRCIEVISVST